MKVENLVLKENTELLSYIDNFDANKVVLTDYFYASSASFVHNSEIYSDKQISRILNLTDREYAELITRYFAPETANVQTDEQKKLLEIQGQLNDVNARLEKSRKFEESEKKIQALEEELQKISKDLSVMNSIDDKLKEAQKEFDKYKHLTKFNLQKIHDDLVKINADITRFEEQLLAQKVVDIKEGRSYYDYDRGKLGLAVGIGIAFAIVGGLFLTVAAPQWVTFTVWGIGFVIAAGIIFTSRYKVVADSESPDEVYDYSDIQDVLDKLRAQRNGILQLLNIKTTDDFFLIKARFASARRGIENIMYQSKNMAQESDSGSMKRKLEIDAEIAKLKSENPDPSVKLTSDQYLELYRESDSLKLKLGQSNSNQSGPNGDIPKRLIAIRKELADKLPGYVSILKSTFESAFDNILGTVKKVCGMIDVAEIDTTKDLNNWDQMDLFSKTMIQYAVAKEIYKNEFAFAVEESDTWDAASQAKLKKLVEANDPELNNTFYLLNNG